MIYFISFPFFTSCRSRFMCCANLIGKSELMNYSENTNANWTWKVTNSKLRPHLHHKVKITSFNTSIFRRDYSKAYNF